MRKAHLGMLTASTAVAMILSAATAGAQQRGMPEPTNVQRPYERGSVTKPMQPAPAESHGRLAPTEAQGRFSPSLNTQPNPRIITTAPIGAQHNARAVAPAVEPPAPTRVSAPAQAQAQVPVPPQATAQVEPPAPVEVQAPVETPVQAQPQALPPAAARATREPSVAPPVASTPARPETVVAPVAGFDLPFSDKLGELIANKAKIERLIPRKNERDAVVALYQKNRFTPLWTDRGMESSRAKTAIAHLQGIDADGLDPAEYRMPNLAATSAEAMAEAELGFTVTLLTYARHASSGRVHFSRVSPNIEYKETFDPADALNKLASSSELARTLDQFNPPHPGYKALKAKYAELRNETVESGPARIASGPVLKFSRDRNGREISMIDPRVPLLRERLGLAAEPNNNYNRPLADAVAKYQKARGLQVSGQLTAATIASLNPMSRDKQIETVLANLERWRWMPRDLGKTHVALNIPDFHLRVMNGGSQVWKTRVVVGKPSQATPLITETMKFITVNPTWNVPQSIIYQELLPIYETSDRAVFEKMGLKVERRQNGEIRVFQPSGERNALGRIRFNFPNKFLVYQHDTPEKHYFAHDKRAYSHGCMRVQDPLKYAEVLLSFAAPRGQHTQESLRRMYGDEERQIDFQQHIPVHISYQTAFVDEGKLQFREDIYDIDSAQMALLKGADRKVADVGIERPADPNFKPTGEHRQRLQSAARNTEGPGSPFSLFDQLFR